MSDPLSDNLDGMQSFAKTVSVLQKLTRMETAISAAIDASKVPRLETRKLLRCNDEGQASSTPLFQFMQNLFVELGLGKLELMEMDRFKQSYIVRDSPVASLYEGINNRKTCYVTSDTIAHFYTKDLNLPCSVEETKCVNMGNEYCMFEVSLQPLAVYIVALDMKDRDIIDLIGKKKGSTVAEIGEALMIEDDEVEYRLTILRNYFIIDDGNSLTKIGKTYHEYGSGLLTEKEEDFAPPWEKLSEITEAISSATSFAEAMSEATDTEAISDIKDADIVNLAEEAKKSQSFAELLSKQIKKEGE